MSGSMRREGVVLRAERNGPDERYLTASRDKSGGLRIRGQDLGPSTIDGDEYEWVRVVAADRMPELLRLLDAEPDADVLEVLAARFCGRGSYELERRLRDTDIAPVEVI
jgi:hypothetical protein